MDRAQGHEESQQRGPFQPAIHDVESPDHYHDHDPESGKRSHVHGGKRAYPDHLDQLVEVGSALLDRGLRFRLLGLKDLDDPDALEQLEDHVVQHVACPADRERAGEDAARGQYDRNDGEWQDNERPERQANAQQERGSEQRRDYARVKEQPRHRQHDRAKLRYVDADRLDDVAVALAVEEWHGESEDMANQPLHHAQLQHLHDTLLRDLVVERDEAARHVGRDQQYGDEPQRHGRTERGRHPGREPASVAQHAVQKLPDQQDRRHRQERRGNRRCQEAEEQALPPPEQAYEVVFAGEVHGAPFERRWIVEPRRAGGDIARQKPERSPLRPATTARSAAAYRTRW